MAPAPNKKNGRGRQKMNPRKKEDKKQVDIDKEIGEVA